MIIEEKTKEKKGPLEGITDPTTPAEVAQASSSIDFAGKYIRAISNADLDAATKLGLTYIKKYWRCIGQVKISLDWLHD